MAAQDASSRSCGDPEDDQRQIAPGDSNVGLTLCMSFEDNANRVRELKCLIEPPVMPCHLERSLARSYRPAATAESKDLRFVSEPGQLSASRLRFKCWPL